MEVPFSTVEFIHGECRKDLVGAFEKVLDSNWFIMGDECRAFEKEFAEYCGTKYAVGCGNGLDSIAIALMAFGIGEGDEVIVPAFTFIATALAVQRTGATPVFVDVEEGTTLIDVSKIEAAITERTKAIAPVHLYGQPADLKAIREIAERHGLKVVADAAQSHGAKIDGRSICAYADATCFSFYPGKNLGALGDAGAAVTDDPGCARVMKALTNYGSEQKYVHDYKGMNSRLDELQSAFLRVKLRSLDAQISVRKKIASRYLAEINDPNVRLPEVKNGDHVYHIFPVYCDDRDALKEYLGSKGVQTNIHYPIPMHMQKAFSDFGLPEGSYPVTERLARTELSIPMFYGMTDDQVSYVIDAINSWRK